MFHPDLKIPEFRKIRVCIAMLLMLSCLVSAQGQGAHRKSHESKGQDQKAAIEKVFLAIENGLSKGDPGCFTQYCTGQTYISLSDVYSGYFSSNQAFYILQNYFSVHQPESFRYTSRNEGESPYATGEYHYETRNRRGTAQVFISLRLQRSDWQISQITIR
jgi:hypothetical protein